MLEEAGKREDERREAARDAQKSLAEQHLEKLAAANGKGKERATDSDASQVFDRSRVGEGEVNLDKSKLASALAAERKRKAMGEEEAFEATKKAKSFNVTEEELGESPEGNLDDCRISRCTVVFSEAYRLSKSSSYDDPMANYQDEES
jgi:pre-mRNA-processing factor SLU7